MRNYKISFRSPIQRAKRYAAAYSRYSGGRHSYPFKSLKAESLLPLVLLLLLQNLVMAQVQPVRRVLILNEVGTSYPGINIIDKGIRSALQDSPYHLEFYTEHMDTMLFPDAADQKLFRDFYLRKYENRKPDVIITVGPSPLEFMQEVHQKAFPGIPIVFCLPHGSVPGIPELDSSFTGVENDIEAAKTVDVALRLLPGTKNVVVAGGTSPYDRKEQAVIKQQLRIFEGRLNVSYLTDLPMLVLLDRLRHLPDHTIVLLTSFGRDATGTRFVAGTESGPKIVAAANVPVFSLIDVFLNHGEVGGDLSSLDLQGTVVGNLALRMITGEKPQNAPKVKQVTSYMFDWRALKRWGLQEGNLPPGSIVLNRELTVWELYKWYIIGGISLILLEALLIGGLFWQLTRRKEVERDLVAAFEEAQEREQRFRLVANTAPVMIWMAGTDKLCTYFNQRWLNFSGRSLDQEMGHGWTEGIHPEDVALCMQIYEQSFDRREPFTMQYRLRRYDGEYRWILDTGVPRFNNDNSFAGYIGSCIDITERKQAEEVLSSVSRRLIDAQERTRIARELHDDINQRIAMLGVELDILQQCPPGSGLEIRKRLHEVSLHLAEIGSEVQAISHRLHSSKLEYLGLAAACRSFCREVAERNKVTIDLKVEDVPAVSRDISLCLFRVLQESLNNAIKHSGAQHFEARLRGTSKEIQLTVRDHGIGLDPDATMHGQGLGLISIRERVNLVKGILLIASKPMEGTEIRVRVPVVAEDASHMVSGAA